MRISLTKRSLMLNEVNMNADIIRRMQGGSGFRQLWLGVVGR